MGCNCSKNSKPTGFAGPTLTPISQSAQEAQRSGAATAPGTPGAQTTSTASKTQSFTLVTTGGKTQSFGSLLEARAARTRAGGGTIR